MLTALCSALWRQGRYPEVDIDISIAHISKLITGHAAMNWMPSRSGVSYSQHLLEEAGKFLIQRSSIPSSIH